MTDNIPSLFKGRNFITPNVIEYGRAGVFVYELSTGRFMSANLYGVTVLTLNGEKTERSRCLHSMTDAREYILTLDDGIIQIITPSSHRLQSRHYGLENN